MNEVYISWFINVCPEILWFMLLHTEIFVSVTNSFESKQALVITDWKPVLMKCWGVVAKGFMFLCFLYSQCLHCRLIWHMITSKSSQRIQKQYSIHAWQLVGSQTLIKIITITILYETYQCAIFFGNPIQNFSHCHKRIFWMAQVWSFCIQKITCSAWTILLTEPTHSLGQSSYQKTGESGLIIHAEYFAPSASNLSPEKDLQSWNVFNLCRVFI